MSSSLLEIMSLIEQVMDEAFSVPKADLTKNGYNGSPHPAAIWQDRQILDNIDLNKFKDMAVKIVTGKHDFQ